MIDAATIEAAVDHCLAQDNELNAACLLRRLDWLDDADARTGPQLLAALNQDHSVVAAALQHAIGYARQIGLLPKFATVESSGLLARIEACHLQRDDVDTQLDLFAHNDGNRRWVELRRALLAWDTEAAQRALAELDELDPGNPRLADHQRLLDVQLHRSLWQHDPEPTLNPTLESITAIAALQFGPEQTRYLRPLWQLLAEALDGKDFDPLLPHWHAQRFWSLLGDGRRALESIEREPDWQGCPQRLEWHALLCERDRDTSAALRDWIALCLDHPAAAEAALPHSALLGAAFRDFLDLDPALDLASFPAWAVLCADQFMPAPADDDQRTGSQTLRIALALRRGDGDLLTLRRQLQKDDPALLRLHLAVRG